MKKLLLIGVMGFALSMPMIAAAETEPDLRPTVSVQLSEEKDVVNDLIDISFTVKGVSVRGNVDEARNKVNEEVAKVKSALSGKYKSIKTVRSTTQNAGQNGLFALESMKVTVKSSDKIVVSMLKKYNVTVNSVSSRLSNNLRDKTKFGLTSKVLDKASKYKTLVENKTKMIVSIQDVIFVPSGNIDPIEYMGVELKRTAAMAFAGMASDSIPQNGAYEEGVTKITMYALVNFKVSSTDIKQ